MIWMTWRQFRTQATTLGGLILAFVAVLAVTAPRMLGLYRASGLAGCAGDTCEAAEQAFQAQVEAHGQTLATVYYAGIAVMFLLPPLIGVFWGAPLVSRELESGTFRLAWSQSVTRSRWLAVKLIGLGLAAMAAAGIASLAYTVWSTPLADAGHKLLDSAVFGTRGVVPVACAAFTYVAGVTAGALARRTLVAMAVTLGVVIVAMVCVPGLRSSLTTPVHLVRALHAADVKGMPMDPSGSRFTIATDVPVTGAAVLSNRVVDASGAPFTGDADPVVCNLGGVNRSGPAADPKACDAWLVSLGLRQDAWYIPESRFWALQWRVSGVYLGLAVLLGAGCFWWVRRRSA